LKGRSGALAPPEALGYIAAMKREDLYPADSESQGAWAVIQFLAGPILLVGGIAALVLYLF
jgi:hypothetical protein